MLSNALIAPIALAVLVLAALAPAYFLVFADLATVLLPGTWDVSEILFNPSDLVMAGLLTALFLRVRNIGRLPKPSLALWAAMVGLMMVSYLSAPIHQQWFEGPIEVGYQLLRYVLKPMLYLPLVLVFFRDERRLDRLVVAFVVVGTMAGLGICLDGFAGESARGPFEGKNLAGGAMVLPFLLGLYQTVKSKGLLSTLFFGGCVLVIGRALLFVGSRGAFASLLFALVLLALPLLRIQNYRYRVFRLVPLAMVVGLLILVAKPDLMGRHSVQALLSVGEGVEENNMQWRMKERWPHFWRIALDNPWLGTGTHVDETLGDRANTPHSGYLAGFVEFGFPVSLLLFGLGLAAVWRCRRLARGLDSEDARLLSTFVGASLMAVFVHLIVEATIFQSDFMMNCYLMLIGISLALGSTAPEAVEERQHERRPRRRLQNRSSEPLVGNAEMSH